MYHECNARAYLGGSGTGNATAPGMVMNLLVSLHLVAVLGQGPVVNQTPAQGPTAQAAEQHLVQAEARYRAAIELDPSIAAYHYSLGVVLERQGRTPEALVSLRQALTLDSTTARHHGAYGDLLLKSGDQSGALAHLREAVKRDPADVDRRIRLAELLIADGETVEAAVLLREAAAASPSDARVANLLRSVDQPAETNGPRDLSDFEDEGSGSIVARVLEGVFGVVLGAAGLVLLVPILSTLFLLLVQAPLEWSRTRR